MGTFELKPSLAWYYSHSDVLPVGSGAVAFPIASYRDHCDEHRQQLCNLNSAGHDPLDPGDHTFDLPNGAPEIEEEVREASRNAFAGFTGKGTYTLDPVTWYHSTSDGSGGWVPDSYSVAHKLLKGGQAETKVISGNTYTLFLHMQATTIFLMTLGPVDAAKLEQASLVGTTAAHLVVRLSRTRSVIMSVRALVDRQDGAREVFELKPAPADRRTFILPAEQIKKRDRLTIEVAYQGEPPVILGEPAVLALAKIATSTPLEDYEKRKKEIEQAKDHVRELWFFLDIDVQFRRDMLDLWKPLTPLDLASDVQMSRRWKRRRVQMTELQSRNALNVIKARLFAADEAEHGRSLKMYASQYGEPHAWEVGMYVSHLDELALAQEVIVVWHFATRQGIGQVDMKALDKAFDLYACGKLRPKDPGFAFRNGEPDSALMFFWAEFAGEVVRRLGPAGTGVLTPDRLWFWERFTRCLVLACEQYRRHYQPNPTNGHVRFEDYGPHTLRRRPHSQLPIPRDPTEFGAWRKLLKRSIF